MEQDQEEIRILNLARTYLGRNVDENNDYDLGVLAGIEFMLNIEKAIKRKNESVQKDS